MDYNFRETEKKWQVYWVNHNTYKVEIDQTRPKYYVLDMFPYPSGAGLHVGHPLGYIASDIYSRYKRMNGFNVLHPMGYDAFGLPAEQYAIQTGRHPAETTAVNIKRYREQMDKIGFSYDWSREVQTCDPDYYKWTQWVFMKMFNHWFNNKTHKAEPIEALLSEFETIGNLKIDAACNETAVFTATEWKVMNEKQKQDILMNYRLAYRGSTMVNWCPALGTVLANDEVRDGFSIRGGHPVVQKKMKQWMLRVSAYAGRLLDGLETIEWSESLKEIQRNWIGRSEGAEIFFRLKKNEQKSGNNEDEGIFVFTTRADTLFGSTFIVLAPESELTALVTTDEYRNAVSEYVRETKKRSERERIAETKKITGQFTGAHVIHPFTGDLMPVWISDYVLAGYGTGAIMAVPGHDSRDFAFAKYFGLPIVQVVSGGDISHESYDAKEGKMINSGFLNGLEVKDAIKRMTVELENKGIGKRKINFRMRDAIFSRQRYWGEPFPVYYKDGIAHLLNEDELPLQLPEIDAFLPTEKGEPPLARAKNWHTAEGYPLEMDTMPGFAGSCAYYIRYMDPRNNQSLVSKKANEYWQDVDLYIGGTEHAVGHLIYSRFWNKFLFDTGIVCKDEPYRKLINQGMIQGRSNFVYRWRGTNIFVTFNEYRNALSRTIEDFHDRFVKPQLGNDISKATYHLPLEFDTLHVDINLVKNDILDIEKFKEWRPEFADAMFIVENDKKYYCSWAVEKMSKSMYNVVNPDDIIEKYGADTLRLYEMFLGPVEQAKPWDTNGIEGVHKFLRKTWRLFHNKNNEFLISEETATQQELKILHKTIKKVTEDIENFSFNTSVSAFMICVNELSELKCNKKVILEELLLLLSPFAPHIAEELWHLCGHNSSITSSSFPVCNEAYLAEDTFEYPVSVNGKLRFKIELPLDMPVPEIEKAVVQNDQLQKWLDGRPPRKIIVVPGKIVNVVV
ncbi:MAG: class I tRNA ligase family protein [Bacteroidia bacterium]|nr:class I tRNA ligase family protein [Bacteroidia bacterium]